MKRAIIAAVLAITIGIFIVGCDGARLDELQAGSNQMALVVETLGDQMETLQQNIEDADLTEEEEASQLSQLAQLQAQYDDARLILDELNARIQAAQTDEEAAMAIVDTAAAVGTVAAPQFALPIGIAASVISSAIAWFERRRRGRIEVQKVISGLEEAKVSDGNGGVGIDWGMAKKLHKAAGVRKLVKDMRPDVTAPATLTAKPAFVPTPLPATA